MGDIVVGMIILYLNSFIVLLHLGMRMDKAVLIFKSRENFIFSKI